LRKDLFDPSIQITNTDQVSFLDHVTEQTLR
jgi:hypothetical protein